MLIKLSGGKVYDPAHQIDGKVMDIYIRDGRIVSRPRDDETIDQTYNLSGKVVMAGAIDMHTHIGGGKVTIAGPISVQLFPWPSLTAQDVHLRHDKFVVGIGGGFECGVGFDKFNDLKVGDVIECFDIEEVARTL